jgi:hypothetical protein
MLKFLLWPVTQCIPSADREFQHRVHITLFTQHWLG